MLTDLSSDWNCEAAGAAPAAAASPANIDIRITCRHAGTVLFIIVSPA
jgi:hypothetical protein